jgi:hypothetical protein
MFDRWRPTRLVESGDQQVSAALRLLAIRGHELSQPARDRAQDLLAQ